MKHMTATLLVSSLLACAGVSAQEVDCANAADQASMNTCADQAYKASDAKLNQSYRALERDVSEDGRVQLRTAQRAWIAYRDAQCAFETAGIADGSVRPMALSSCLDTLTQAQTARLEAQSNCAEGDLSCGNQ